MGVLGKNYFHTVATNVVLKLILGLAIGVVTARALGPAGRGEYNLLVLVVTTLTTLFNFGIPASNTYFVAKRGIPKEKLLRGSFLIALVVSAFSFLLLYVLYLTGFLAYLFPVEKLTLSIVASLGIIPIAFFNLFAQGIIVGENKIFLNNYIYLGSQSTLAAALALAYAFGVLTVPLAIVFFAVSNLVAFGIIAVAYRSTLFAGMLPRMEWREYKQLLGFSMPLQAGIIIQFFNYRLDAFLVNYFLGTLSVGLYVMAVNLVEILWLLSSSMASVLLPTIAAQHEHSKKISVKAAMASFGVTVVGGIAAFVIAPPLIVLLFGKDFAGSVAPFLILLPGIMIFSITNVLAAYMTGIGKPGFNTAIALISLVFTVVLDLVLIPRIGIAGAAFASSVSYTVTSLMSLVIFIKLSGLTWTECGEYMVSFKSDFQSIATRARLKMLSIVS